MPANIVAGEDRAGIFSAVQHKRFRPLWTASILSGVAYMTALTACGWVAFDLHHHSSTVGLVVFASFLPSLIITPFAGVFADRYDRRTMLLTMNAIGLLSTLGLAWVAWAGDQRACWDHTPFAQFARGASYVFHPPAVCSVTPLVVLHCAFTRGSDAALPRRASDVLGATGTAYSLLMMAMGGGSLVGAFLLAGFARRVHCGYLFFATSILSGLTLVPLGYAASWPGALLAAAAVGLTQSMFIALATTLLQIATPDPVRGRVLGLYWGSTGGGMAVSNLATGRLADGVGAGPMLALPGLAFGAVTVITLCAPTLREIYGRRLASTAAVHDHSLPNLIPSRERRTGSRSARRT